MRQLLNTLYVTTENAFLSLDGENVSVSCGKEEFGRFPLHLFDSIISFSYAGATPALMGKCLENGVALTFCTPFGKFLARVDGRVKGNVLLRQEQYRFAEDANKAAEIAQMFLIGKVFNTKWVVERTRRDHRLRVNDESLSDISKRLSEAVCALRNETNIDSLRGIEGSAAADYFSVFNEMILQNKETFFISSRNRRPPKDPINALLSFVYTLLAGSCEDALEAIGLDPYRGFLHTVRPGRRSLALDLMEELRPCIADRLVLTLVNDRMVNKDDFDVHDDGAVWLSGDGRKKVLTAWQNKKKEQIIHPYLNEKIPWGLVPYIQAQLLSRHIRGDLEAYPPFLWK